MKIIHVDDHPLFSECMSSLLSLHDSTMNVLSFASGREALALLDTEKDIDLILIDLDMPDINGFSMLEAIKQRGLDIPVIVISGSEDLWEIRAVMESGAAGFVPKTNKPKQLLEVLKVVLEGGNEPYLPDDIKVAISCLPRITPSDEVDRLLAQFGISAKQFEVLNLMSKGYNTVEIAKMQFVSENTIKSHTSALFTALEVKERLKCVTRASSLGLLPRS